MKLLPALIVVMLLPATGLTETNIHYHIASESECVAVLLPLQEDNTQLHLNLEKALKELQETSYALAMIRQNLRQVQQIEHQQQVMIAVMTSMKETTIESCENRLESCRDSLIGCTETLGERDE